MPKSPIDVIFNQAEWVEIDQESMAHDEDIPYATAKALVEFVPGLTLRVYLLNTGERVIDETSLQRLFRWLAGEESR